VSEEVGCRFINPPSFRCFFSAVPKFHDCVLTPSAGLVRYEYFAKVLKGDDALILPFTQERFVPPPDEQPSLADLSPVQRAALAALWEVGAGTVYDLLDRFPEPKPPYTSVLSALQKLRKFGWVSFESVAGEKGRYYVYRPTRSREEAERTTARNVVEEVFSGDAFRLAQHLLGQETLSPEQLAQLRKLIDARRRGKRADQ
jgi:predicted transcriptional regulator